jgi:predicted DCC family thiol-disulfide oxidoreductase YuxK
MQKVVFFDGDCMLCHKAIQFILKHEKAPVLQFCSLQDAAHIAAFKNLGISAEGNSVVFLENGFVYTKAAAAFRLCAYLYRPWSFLQYLSIVPAFISTSVYELIANNRFKIWGRANSCLLINRRYESRILGIKKGSV